MTVQYSYGGSQNHDRGTISLTDHVTYFFYHTGAEFATNGATSNLKNIPKTYTVLSIIPKQNFLLSYINNGRPKIPLVVLVLYGVNV